METTKYGIGSGSGSPDFPSLMWPGIVRCFFPKTCLIEKQPKKERKNFIIFSIQCQIENLTFLNTALHFFCKETCQLCHLLSSFFNFKLSSDLIITLTVR
jgi:hypothetical protein